MNEYISKQRAKDLMGCCLASAKANYKDETSVFKKEQFKHYAETIEAMIDVVGAVEAADVQPVKRGKWEKKRGYLVCSNCGMTVDTIGYTYEEQEEVFRYCSCCGYRMDGDAE